jgi:hypothetical protein
MEVFRSTILKRQQTLSMRRQPLKSWRELILPIPYPDAFPSKTPSIDRPGARAEQGQGSNECAQENVSREIPGLRESVPQLDGRYKSSRDRRTQACEQKDPPAGRGHARYSQRERKPTA